MCLRLALDPLTLMDAFICRNAENEYTGDIITWEYKGDIITWEYTGDIITWEYTGDIITWEWIYRRYHHLRIYRRYHHLRIYRRYHHLRIYRRYHHLRITIYLGLSRLLNSKSIAVSYPVIGFLCSTLDKAIVIWYRGLHITSYFNELFLV